MAVLSKSFPLETPDAELPHWTSTGKRDKHSEFQEASLILDSTCEVFTVCWMESSETAEPDWRD